MRILNKNKTKLILCSRHLSKTDSCLGTAKCTWTCSNSAEGYTYPLQILASNNKRGLKICQWGQTLHGRALSQNKRYNWSRVMGKNTDNSSRSK